MPTADLGTKDDRRNGEIDRLRRIVDDIRRDTRAVARLQAALVQHRAAAMRIALDQVARSTSRASRERELPVRSLALEIAIATRTHDTTVQKELSESLTLTEKFPATVAAMAEGRISLRHAHAIVDAGIVLDDDDVRAGWETVVLARAERDTPGRVRAYGRELAESVQPVGMTERHRRAALTRGITVRDLADGMAELILVLPATVAYGIRDRLRRQAAALRDAAPNTHDAEPADTTAGIDTAIGTGTDAPPSPVDTRTAAHRQADIAADLLLTAAPAFDPTDDGTCPGGLGAVRGHVQVTVPVTTLMGRDDVGAVIDGGIPIDPTTARQLAARAPGWDRILCHPITGTVLEVDRYSPTTSQRRFLAARDRHCRAPGCRAPIRRCQLDHNHEAQHGGPTRLTNLCYLCVRHHTLKTEQDWTVIQDGDGSLRFHSPLGQRMTERLPARVFFVPDPVADDLREGPPPL